MEIPEQLRTLFSASIEERDDSYLIEVPDEELRLGEIQKERMYRVAILSTLSNDERVGTDTEPKHESDTLTPPVAEGETRTVEIEDIGDQGDGITRVERGFVVIIPNTEQGERVTVEITDVRENVAFANVIKRLSYYD